MKDKHLFHQLCVWLSSETSPHAFQLELFFNNVPKPNSPAFNRLGRWGYPTPPQPLHLVLSLSWWGSPLYSLYFLGGSPKCFKMHIFVWPVEPVTVASKPSSQRPVGCVCMYPPIFKLLCSCFSELVSPETQPHPCWNWERCTTHQSSQDEH